MSDGLSYDYAVGRIRALEIKLFDKSFLSRLEASDNAPDAASMLSERGFPAFSFSRDDAGVREYINNLESYEKQFLDDLKKFIPEPRIADIYLLKTDFSNLKICIKSENKDGIVLSDNGLYSSEDLLQMYLKNDYSVFGKCSSMISEASEVYNTTRSGMKADCILDKAYYTCIREIASSAYLSTRPVLKKYIGFLTDLQNKKTYDRIIKRGGNMSVFKDAYIPGPTPAERISSFVLPDSENDPELRYLKSISADPVSCGAVLSYIVSKKRDISDARVILVKKLIGGLR